MPVPHRMADPTSPPAHAIECTLDDAPPIARLEVIRIDSAQGTERLLAQLGILVGVGLRVLRKAPLGGPILVEVHGSSVAIGRALARRVWVKSR